MFRKPFRIKSQSAMKGSDRCVASSGEGSRHGSQMAFTWAMGKMRNCGMWNAEGKMRNENCGTMTVIGPQVRPRDRRHYAVYRTARGRRSGKLRNADVESRVLCMLQKS